MSDNLCAICKQAPRNPLANVCQSCSDEIERRQARRTCPACEAAARERDAAYEDARQMQARLQRLIDAEPQRELADLRARLTRAARLLDVVAENQMFVQPEFEEARALLRKEVK